MIDKKSIIFILTHWKSLHIFHLLRSETPKGSPRETGLCDFSQHVGSDVFQIIHISVEPVWRIIFFSLLFWFFLFFDPQKQNKKYYNYISII